MPMPASEIEALIKAAIPGAEVTIRDVRGEFVGGSDIMMEMFESGELQQLLGAEA